MRTLLLGVLLSSTLAFAGSGGMVGGGKRPPTLIMMVQETQVSLEAKIFRYGNFSIATASKDTLAKLHEAAEKGMTVTVSNGFRGTIAADIEILDQGVIALKMNGRIATYIVGSAVEE